MWFFCNNFYVVLIDEISFIKLRKNVFLLFINKVKISWIVRRVYTSARIDENCKKFNLFNHNWNMDNIKHTYQRRDNFLFLSILHFVVVNTKWHVCFASLPSSVRLCVRLIHSQRQNTFFRSIFILLMYLFTINCELLHD